LTLILYIAFIGVRLTNPDLWHSAKGGEKPMDFTFFNGVLRSTLFPAYDPWYADGYINYYYVGYVVVGSPVLLLKMVPAFAYNLIIPTLFALAGIGAFSAAYNIVSVWRERPLVAFYGEDAAPRSVGNPYVAGVAALLLCVVLGNLDTIRVFGNGLATLGGYQTSTGMENWYTEQFIRNTGGTPTPELQAEFKARAENANIFDRATYELDHFFTLVGSLISGTGRALNGATLPIGSDRWYWGPSRVLSETPGVEGNAINEMPYFTFLYGDLHAHMISLPILLFMIAFVFNEVVLAGHDSRTGWIGFLALAIGGITVGMTRAINTWDLPTFLALSIAGLGYAWWLRWGRISRWSLLHLLYYVGGFLVFVIAAAQPYAYWYAAVYGAMQPWTGGKTPVWAYFDIHGLFLFLVISLLAWDTSRWLRSIKVKALRGQVNWVMVAGMIVSLVLLSALVTGLTGYQAALIVVPLILWIVPLFFRHGQSRSMQFALVLAGLSLLLTLVVEIVVLGGDIGRQNTVFKFYMHVWILLSVVGGAACAWLVQASDYWSNKLRVVWYVPGMLLFMVATMYPIMATRARSLERMVPDLPLTLNGMDYMAQAEHQLMDYPETVSLKNDYAIIRWLQDNVQGSPVIMEGRSLASEYRWNSRIAIYTGLPSVLGWNFHQRQQRTFDPLPRLVEQREYNIKYFYNAANIDEAVRILRHYDVRYVIVSDMERAMNSSQALAKFDTMVENGLLTIAFQQDAGVIYEVDQAALDEFAFQNQNEG
jgi:YYY domain-containing protein